LDCQVPTPTPDNVRGPGTCSRARHCEGEIESTVNLRRLRESRSASARAVSHVGAVRLHSSAHTDDSRIPAIALPPPAARPLRVSSTTTTTTTLTMLSGSRTCLTALTSLLALTSPVSPHLLLTYPGWRGNSLDTTGYVNQTNGMNGVVSTHGGSSDLLYPFGQQWAYPCTYKPPSSAHLALWRSRDARDRAPATVLGERTDCGSTGSNPICRLPRLSRTPTSNMPLLPPLLTTST